MTCETQGPCVELTMYLHTEHGRAYSDIECSHAATWYSLFDEKQKEDMVSFRWAIER